MVPSDVKRSVKKTVGTSGSAVGRLLLPPPSQHRSALWFRQLLWGAMTKEEVPRKGAFPKPSQQLGIY